MNDGEILQNMTNHVCEIIGIHPCIVQLTTNQVSKYKGKISTIALRTQHKSNMLSIRDAWIHELTHHVQVQLQGFTSHNYQFKLILISLLDYLEIKNYAWNKEYKSLR